ncbi:hypothetical protein [Flavobacterium sp. HNIBRBA15423]|uniref:hypothetical protein n=1 Tax=Flavobacterium sp. HNIBRBA15423 TaxID=3458683 RepID=UPI004043AE46
MANPFKKVEDFEEEINDFLKRNKTFISNQGKRISDYFEMSCYNYIVKFYQNEGFKLEVKNLIAKKFKYKLSPSGYPENFSFFEIRLINIVEGQDKEVCFEIHHNLTVQSGYQHDIYLTPDISVINKDTIVVDKDHYLVENSTKKFCYVENINLQTFCEVKNFNPFPELLFNFVGLYNELKKEVLENNSQREFPHHLAPSLMISGKGNVHSERIKKSLESRYKINLLYDLFDHGLRSFSKYNSKYLKQVASLNPKMFELVTLDEIINEEDLPF